MIIIYVYDFLLSMIAMRLSDRFSAYAKPVDIDIIQAIKDIIKVERSL